MNKVLSLLILLFIANVTYAIDSRFVVVIDAGHGGKDTGATRGGYKEKDINLQTEKTQKEEKVLTPVQIQRRKKMLVYPLFFLIFVGSMYLIFAPSSDKKEIKEELSWRK